MLWRYRLTLLFTSSAVRVWAQDFLPPCANPCFNSADFGSCAETDDTCLCSSDQPYLASLDSCMVASCSRADLQAGRVYQQSICELVGEPIYSLIPINSASTGTSATAMTPTKTSATDSSALPHSSSRTSFPTAIASASGGTAFATGSQVASNTGVSPTQGLEVTSGQSHSGPSEAVILAVAITIPICAVIATLLIFLWMRRKSRARSAPHCSVEGVTIEEYRHRGAPSLGDGMRSSGRWRCAGDTTPMLGHRAILSVASVSSVAFSNGTQRTDASQDLDSALAQDGSASPVSEHIRALPDRTVAAHEGSAASPKTLSLAPDKAAHATLPEAAQDAPVQRRAPADSERFSSTLPPRALPGSEAMLPSEDINMVLVRLPLGVAQRILATMARIPPHGADGEWRGSEVSRESEPLPAYEPPSSA